VGLTFLPIIFYTVYILFMGAGTGGQHVNREVYIVLRIVHNESAVTLGNFFDFLLLLEGVGGLQVALLDVDELVGEHLSDTLLGAEGVLADALGDQVDGLVDPSQRRYVDRLLPHHAASSDTRGVLPGSGLHDGVDEHLERVAAGQQVDDLEGVAHDADGLHLLAGVATVELQ
jgi:hypothetical protein